MDGTGAGIVLQGSLVLPDCVIKPAFVRQRSAKVSQCFEGIRTKLEEFSVVVNSCGVVFGLLRLHGTAEEVSRGGRLRQGHTGEQG